MSGTPDATCSGLAGRGWADPSLTPRTYNEHRAIERAIEHGFRLERVRPGRPAVRLIGPGVHSTFASLDDVKKLDFVVAQITHPPRQLAPSSPKRSRSGAQS